MKRLPMVVSLVLLSVAVAVVGCAQNGEENSQNNSSTSVQKEEVSVASSIEIEESSESEEDRLVSTLESNIVWLENYAKESIYIDEWGYFTEEFQEELIVEFKNKQEQFYKDYQQSKNNSQTLSKGMELQTLLIPYSELVNKIENRWLLQKSISEMVDNPESLSTKNNEMWAFSSKANKEIVTTMESDNDYFVTLTSSNDLTSELEKREQELSSSGLTNDVNSDPNTWTWEYKMQTIIKESKGLLDKSNVLTEQTIKFINNHMMNEESEQRDKALKLRLPAYRAYVKRLCEMKIVYDEFPEGTYKSEVLKPLVEDTLNRSYEPPYDEMVKQYKELYKTDEEIKGIEERVKK